MRGVTLKVASQARPTGAQVRCSAPLHLWQVVETVQLAAVTTAQGHQASWCLRVFRAGGQSPGTGWGQGSREAPVTLASHKGIHTSPPPLPPTLPLTLPHSLAQSLFPPAREPSTDD